MYINISYRVKYLTELVRKIVPIKNQSEPTYHASKALGRALHVERHCKMFVQCVKIWRGTYICFWIIIRISEYPWPCVWLQFTDTDFISVPIWSTYSANATSGSKESCWESAILFISSRPNCQLRSVEFNYSEM